MLNPLFSKVVEFLRNNELSQLPLGKIFIQGDDLFVNIVDSPAKQQEDARLESHDLMIDIQIPISSIEVHGYTPRKDLPEVAYDEAKDISFYPGSASRYFEVKPGEFVIYFPTDGHAPAITPVTLRKAIFKIKHI